MAAEIRGRHPGMTFVGRWWVRMLHGAPIRSVAALQTALAVRLSDVAAPGGPFQVLCDACQSLLAVDGASVTISNATGTRETLCASNQTIALLEQLEYTLGEGPAHQAYTTGRPVLISDLDADGTPEWPTLASSLASSLAGTSIAAIFAFPLQYGSARAGTLMLYRATAGRLSAEHLANALQIVDLATGLLIGLPDGMDGASRDGPPNSYISLAPARGRVHQATGMLMAEFTIPADQALSRLRGHAFATGRLIDDVAADLVASRLRPSDLGGLGG